MTYVPVPNRPPGMMPGPGQGNRHTETRIGGSRSSNRPVHSTPRRGPTAGGAHKVAAGEPPAVTMKPAGIKGW